MTTRLRHRPGRGARAGEHAGDRIYVRVGTKAGAASEGMVQVRASVAAGTSVHFSQNRILWDGFSQQQMTLERSGDPSLPLTVNLLRRKFRRHTRFD